MSNVQRTKMNLEFIGQDGIHELQHGTLYDCEVWTSMGYIWVAWTDDIPYKCCPYGSFNRFLANWRIPINIAQETLSLMRNDINLRRIYYEK